MSAGSLQLRRSGRAGASTAWGATGTLGAPVASRSRRPQAKLKAEEEARKAAEAQARVASGENGDDNGEDKKEESSSDDEEPEARRRLERRGRGLGRADAAQRWRDLEAKADQLCQRAARHAPSVTQSIKWAST